MNWIRKAFISLFILLGGVCFTQDLKAQSVADRALLDSVFAYMCELKIQHPEIVIRQVVCETGWFSNKNLMTKRNFFGFRYKTYLSFATWKEGVEYYKRWQDKRYLDPTEDYYHFLVRVHYASAGYPALLKKVKLGKEYFCNE